MLLGFMSRTFKIIAAMSILIGHGLGQQQPPKTSTAPGNQPLSRWRVSSKKNEMDGVVTTTLITRSLNLGAAGALIIRCGGDKAEVYVSVGDQVQPELGGGHSVRIKFDSEAPIPEGWNESTDSRALFSYLPLQLMHRLLTTKRFLFEFTPFESSNRVLSFDLTGLFRAITPAITKSCGELSPDDQDPYKPEVKSRL